MTPHQVRLTWLAEAARGLVDAMANGTSQAGEVQEAEAVLVGAALLCPSGAVAGLDGFSVGELCMFASVVGTREAA